MTPLLVQEVLDEQNRKMGWAVEGRPADCVKLALLELLPEQPDVIVSGLNAGSNAGINVLYSGTVAAAIEGHFSAAPVSRCPGVSQAEAARLRTSRRAGAAGDRTNSGVRAAGGRPFQRQHSQF